MVDTLGCTHICIYINDTSSIAFNTWKWVGPLDYRLTKENLRFTIRKDNGGTHDFQ